MSNDNDITLPKLDLTHQIEEFKQVASEVGSSGGRVYAVIDTKNSSIRTTTDLKEASSVDEIKKYAEDLLEKAEGAPTRRKRVDIGKINRKYSIETSLDIITDAHHGAMSASNQTLISKTMGSIKNKIDKFLKRNKNFGFSENVNIKTFSKNDSNDRDLAGIKSYYPRSGKGDDISIKAQLKEKKEQEVPIEKQKLEQSKNVEKEKKRTGILKLADKFEEQLFSDLQKQLEVDKQRKPQGMQKVGKKELENLKKQTTEIKSFLIEQLREAQQELVKEAKAKAKGTKELIPEEVIVQKFTEKVHQELDKDRWDLDDEISKIQEEQGIGRKEATAKAKQEFMDEVNAGLPEKKKIEPYNTLYSPERTQAIKKALADTLSSAMSKNKPG